MSDTKKLHSGYLLATADDYERLFALLEWWVKPLLEREIERQRISSDVANHGWIAWLNTKQVVMAMLRAGLSPAELMELLGEVEEERAMPNGLVTT